MGHKAVKTTHNINNAFGSVNANKCTVEWWFKKFCKGDESLEIEEHSGWLSEGDNNQLRAIIKADPLKIHRQLLKNSTSIILCSFGIGNKLKGEMCLKMMYSVTKFTQEYILVSSGKVQQCKTTITFCTNLIVPQSGII